MTRDFRDVSHLWLHARISLAVHKIEKYYGFEDDTEIKSWSQLRQRNELTQVKMVKK
jgi:hypothetical protein